MTRHSKTDYFVRIFLTVVFFITALFIIGFGLFLVATTKDLITQGAGLILSSLTTIGGMLTRFWRSSIEDIKSSHIQQVGVEAAFISFMTQNGQVRLAFSKDFEEGKITLEQLTKYRNLAAEMSEQLTNNLLKFEDRQS